VRHLKTEVLVIGGGATGAGIVRDLAMRGFKTILVEKSDLSTGTTGRYHGLLHSGGRYVVKDQLAAKECIEENRILRRIIPHCIEDTGGFFVLTPWDEPEYALLFLAGCKNAGIPVDEISLDTMLRQEPLLNPKILRCFRVPDASADSFQATEANANSAREFGASILNYHPVIKLLQNKSNSQANQIMGAICHDLFKDEEVHIDADLVINASGAWAGQIAGMAGIQLTILPGKGTLFALNHRIVNTVINRCRLPSDGDILVPAHTVTVMGTTDIPVDDPDKYPIEPWEIKLLLEEGEKIIPGFKDMRILRAWAGVRPLYQETQISANRQISRSHVLLDHEVRDGVSDFISITSGKWTTYRKMAEVTVDLACTKLASPRPCRTHLEPLPNAKGPTYHSLGSRLAKIEKDTPSEIICECELVTQDQIEQAILDGNARTIDDIRRDTRLGMGPCQGGFCTFRTAGILHNMKHRDARETNLALYEFLQERWKGLLPIIWGSQLRQARLDLLIYSSLLNIESLPLPQKPRLVSYEYAQPCKQEPEIQLSGPKKGLTEVSKYDEPESPPDHPKHSTDVLVIGAGLAGLVSAWQAAQNRKRTSLIAKGMGSLYFHAGCIDVLGKRNRDENQPIESPGSGITELIKTNPDHPYAKSGLDELDHALQDFKRLCNKAGYPMLGSLERNWLLPTASGGLRPTCLAPQTMISGDLCQPEPMLIVGFKQYPDFYSKLIADNLTLQGIPASGITISIENLENRRFVNSINLAAMFEQVDFRQKVVRAIQAAWYRSIPGIERLRIGFPAVLGIDNAGSVIKDLENQLGYPVFEIPTLPPSIPGMRISRLLHKAIEKSGGRVFEGMQVVSSEIKDQHIIALQSEAAARLKSHSSNIFILATGGILGGGISLDADGKIHESILNLEIYLPELSQVWFSPQFLDPMGHSIFHTGITVDQNFRPVDRYARPIYDNLFAVGTGLSGGDYVQERSWDGVALVSGYLAGKLVASR